MAGARDGRVSEKLRQNYTPVGLADFDAEKEWRGLHELIKQAEVDAEGPVVTAELTRQAMGKEHAAKICRALRWKIRFARGGFAGLRPI